jgi:hypothetical protein
MGARRNKMTQSASLVATQLRPVYLAENVKGAISATGDTVILEMNLGGVIQNLGVEVVVGVNSLDNLLVEIKRHPNSSWTTYTNGITSTPAGLILAASGTLSSQAVGTGWFVMDVRGLYGVRVSASGTTDEATTVTGRACGS